MIFGEMPWLKRSDNQPSSLQRLRCLKCWNLMAIQVVLVSKNVIGNGKNDCHFAMSNHVKIYGISKASLYPKKRASRSQTGRTAGCMSSSFGPP